MTTPPVSIPPPLTPPTVSPGSSGDSVTASSADEPEPVFAAALSEVQNTFYADNVLLCHVAGHATLVVEGRNMVNVELLPAEGYVPVYGEFAVSEDGTQATFALDTYNQFTPGILPVRISAFDAPRGQLANEIIAMSPRTWRLSPGTCNFSSNEYFVAAYPDGPPLSVPR